MRGKIERAGPCPVCGGRDRFSVNVRKQVFNCRGCQIGGDVIKLTQLLACFDPSWISNIWRQAARPQLGKPRSTGKGPTPTDNSTIARPETEQHHYPETTCVRPVLERYCRQFRAQSAL
jgi:hypothetical protein